MKTMMTSKTTMSLLALMLMGLFTINTVNAQRGRGWKAGPSEDRPGEKSCMTMLDLSEEQEEQIDKLRTRHMKEMLPLKNEMMELKAKLNSLTTGEDVNMKKVEKKVDEIVELKAKLMKKRIAHRQEVRALLKEDQKILFDTHHLGRGEIGFGSGRMHRGFHGKGRGYGPCGQGKGPGPRGL